MGMKDFSRPNAKDNNPNNNGGNPPQISPDDFKKMLFGGSLGEGDEMASGQMIDPLEFLINYNEQYKNAGPTLFREKIVQQTLSILIGKNKPNGLLVGSAGVGKTKIVEDIAYRLANDDSLIPDILKGYTIYELPIQNIVSGSVLVGQLEMKLKAVVDFVANPDNKAILFIDEIHQLVTGQPHYKKIAELLKPELTKGNVRLIGSTTIQESKDFMSNPAFSRRFTQVIVDELTKEQTLEILKANKNSFINHYKGLISIDDKVLESVVETSDAYHQAGSHRPDTALTLLDRAIADAIIARKVLENSAKTSTDPQIVAAYNTIKNVKIIPLTDRQVKITAIRCITGNTEKVDLDIDVFRSHFDYIKGQDDAVRQIVDAIQRYNLDLFPRTKPLTFLFAGSSGVGKTEIAKIIAQDLTSVKPIILNMTEYAQEGTVNNIIGSPTGFIGSDSKAELPFDSLASNPYQVILLDEFEKANKSVQRLFMQAFDEGHIKTNHSGTIDFSKSIVILTTNAAHKQAKKTLGFCEVQSSNELKSEVNDLGKWFDMELLNRINYIITFNELGEDVYTEIMRNTYHTEIKRIKSIQRRINLPDEMPEDDLKRLVQSTYIRDFGARPVYKTVRAYIENTVIEQANRCKLTSAQISTAQIETPPDTEVAKALLDDEQSNKTDSINGTIDNVEPPTVEVNAEEENK